MTRMAKAVVSHYRNIKNREPNRSNYLTYVRTWCAHEENPDRPRLREFFNYGIVGHHVDPSSHRCRCLFEWSKDYLKIIDVSEYALRAAGYVYDKERNVVLTVDGLKEVDLRVDRVPAIGAKSRGHADSDNMPDEQVSAILDIFTTRRGQIWCLLSWKPSYIPLRRITWWEVYKYEFMQYYNANQAQLEQFEEFKECYEFFLCGKTPRNEYLRNKSCLIRTGPSSFDPSMIDDYDNADSMDD